MAKFRVRNLRQTHISIDARISKKLIYWLITADNLLTIMSAGKVAGFNGILDCRLVLE